MRFTIPSIVVILPALIGWFIALPWLRSRPLRAWSFERAILWTGFVVYLLAVVHITIFPIRVHTGAAYDRAHYKQSVGLVPFDNLNPSDFALNILLTMPLGFGIALLLPKLDRIGIALAIGVITGAGIESAQWLMRVTIANDRDVSMNDVIANTTGVVVGLLLFRIGNRIADIRGGLNEIEQAR